MQYKHHNGRHQKVDSAMFALPPNWLLLCKQDIHKHTEPASVCMHANLQRALAQIHSTNMSRACQWFSDCSQSFKHPCVHSGNWKRRGHISRFLSSPCSLVNTQCWSLLQKVWAAGTAVHVATQACWTCMSTHSMLWDENIHICKHPMLKSGLTRGTNFLSCCEECALLKGSDMYLSAGL